MTQEDLQIIPIERIIWMPNFISLSSGGGFDNAFPGEPVKEPYWEITFRGNPR